MNWNLKKKKSENMSDNSQDNLNIADRFIINENKFRDIQHTIQSDLTWPMANKQSIELGFKGILRDAFSDYESNLKNLSTQKFEIDPTNSNRYNFKQQVWGVYTTYRFSLGKYRFIPGVRVEKTNITANFQSTATQAKQQYSNVFPNINIRRNFTKYSQSIGFSYSRKLARPDISYLNPFVRNSDPLFITVGNPALNPEFTDEFSISYGFNKSKFNFNTTLTHERTTNEILAYTSFDPVTGISQTGFENLGKTNTTTLTFYFRIQLTEKNIV